jgi:hypothetical protein
MVDSLPFLGAPSETRIRRTVPLGTKGEPNPRNRSGQQAGYRRRREVKRDKSCHQPLTESLAMPKDQPGSSDTLPVERRGCGRPTHVPTKIDRDTVVVMVAAGVQQDDIAKARGISTKTLRKHYRPELDTGQTTIDTIVVSEHLKRIKAGDFPAIKWWEQARMNWRGDAGDEDGRLPEAAMRVVVEFVGEPAPTPPPIDHEPTDRGRDAARKHVKLVG